MLHVLCALTINLQDLISHLKYRSLVNGTAACFTDVQNSRKNTFSSSIPSSFHFWQQPHPLQVLAHKGPYYTPTLLLSWSQSLYYPSQGPQSRTLHPVRQTDRKVKPHKHDRRWLICSVQKSQKVSFDIRTNQALSQKKLPPKCQWQNNTLDCMHN